MNCSILVVFENSDANDIVPGKEFDGLITFDIVNSTIHCFMLVSDLQFIRVPRQMINREGCLKTFQATAVQHGGHQNDTVSASLNVTIIS